MEGRGEGEIVEVIEGLVRRGGRVALEVDGQGKQRIVFHCWP